MSDRSARLAGVVVALVLASAIGRAGQEQTDTTRVEEVFRKYLTSVKTADIAVASQVWSQTPDVIAVTPFGRFQGWDTIRTSLYTNFLQQAFSERNLEPSNVSTHVNGDTAWLVFDWVFTAKTTKGQPITSKGWESHIYKRTPTGWVLVALHYSVPPPRP
jgi:ketosteroid isomerase-like protein